jgi:hypothetical protein
MIRYMYRHIGEENNGRCQEKGKQARLVHMQDLGMIVQKIIVDGFKSFCT